MKIKWNVDDSNTVTARLGDFRKSRITINGREIPSALNMRGEHEFTFALADGRPARISVQRPFLMRPVVELWVEGKRIAATGKKALTCAACGCMVKPNERTCLACGKETPPVERNPHKQAIRAGKWTIAVLAAMFTLIAVVLFVGTQGAVKVEQATLQRMNADDPYPQAYGGVTYTVGELSEHLAQEPYAMLIGGLIMAGIMALLALLSMRWPLVPMLVALAIYVAFTVAEVVLEPHSLWRATLFKILVVVFLVRGIKAALALRRAKA